MFKGTGWNDKLIIIHSTIQTILPKVFVAICSYVVFHEGQDTILPSPSPGATVTFLSKTQPISPLTSYLILLPMILNKFLILSYLKASWIKIQPNW